MNVTRVSTPNGPVYVGKPEGYNGSAVVAYIHGYYVNVDQAVTQYKLFEQFDKSGVKAIFVVPEAPSGNEQGVFFPSLEQLLSHVGITATSVSTVAHSGGYRTVLKWLGAPLLKSVVLLDALYGGTADFANWAAKPGHKLVSVVVTEKPTANSKTIAQKPNVSVVPARTTHMGLVTSGTYIPQVIRLVGSSFMAAAGSVSSVLLLLAAVAFGYYMVRG
jgi:hypothetical protein